MRGLFITGTDTCVGKTVVSALLIHHAITMFEKVSYYKPVQTGPDRDTTTIEQLVPKDRCSITAGFSLKRPLSPHRAAYYENVTIDFPTIIKTAQKIYAQSFALIEGAGGLLVPLNQNRLMIDMIKELRIPCVLVCRSSLGTINHTLLSIEALRRRNIPLAGIVMVGKKNRDNENSIKFYGKATTLIPLPHLQIIDQNVLSSLAHTYKNSLELLFTSL